MIRLAVACRIRDRTWTIATNSRSTTLSVDTSASVQRKAKARNIVEFPPASFVSRKPRCNCRAACPPGPCELPKDYSNESLAVNLIGRRRRIRLIEIWISQTEYQGRRGIKPLLRLIKEALVLFARATIDIRHTASPGPTSMMGLACHARSFLDINSDRAET